MTTSPSTDGGDTLTRDQRKAAVALAERTIAHGVEHGEPLSLNARIEELFPDGDRATFVTVELAGELNGCIGRLAPTRPLPEDIVHNAYRAAFRDHRFPPVGPEDLDATSVHISVLNPLEPIPADEEADIWESVEPGRHGLLLATDDKHGTFLPSVWEKVESRDQFLAHLKRKAGLPPDAWPPNLRVLRYTVDEFDRKTLREETADAPAG